MTIYAISGLGADKRVYEYLNLDFEIIHLDWIQPIKNESIPSYAQRLSLKINTKEPFALIGMSFGGIIATEISKQLSPKYTILISSAETKYELRTIYRWFGKLNIIRFFPLFCFDMPRPIAYYIFGAKNKVLLKAILDDADLFFTKWAINQISKWGNTKTINNCFKIGGSQDKLIPQNISKIGYPIKNGEHFMIVDKANEISQALNSIISDQKIISF